ncbi:DMT family transporter [Nibricoccus sp. IMCC34717]|uniref:DMT family transporter n=1 Tax=Nibricoccus sp. IMCC34717 TaxID=3034021 RepID=UPI00384BCDC1
MSSGLEASRGGIRDWFLLIFCNLVWASQFAMVKLVQKDCGPLFTTSFPMAIATLALGGVLYFRPRAARESGLFSRRGVPSLILLGLFGQLAAQLGATWGVQRSLASNAAVLSLTLPLASAVMAFLFLGEKMTRRRWVGFGVATVGVTFCSLGEIATSAIGERGHVVGDLLIVGSVLGSAFYNVYSKKLLVRHDEMEILFGSYVVVCAVLVPLTVIQEPESFRMLGQFTATTWLGLAILAAFQYFLSMVVFLRVLKNLSAIQASLSTYLIPVFGLLIAWAVLGEHLQFQTLAAGLIVLIGIWVSSAPESKVTQRNHE